MVPSRLGQLEAAVVRLLQRNSQLQGHCQSLLSEQEGWQKQRRELLTEVEVLLSDLESLRGVQP
jgi:ParB-like chromosome segregation protein Spo0J